MFVLGGVILFSRTLILQRYSTSVPLPTGIVVQRNVTADAVGQYSYIAYCLRRAFWTLIMRSYFGFGTCTQYVLHVVFANSMPDFELHAREFLPHPDAVITE